MSAIRAYFPDNFLCLIFTIFHVPHKKFMRFGYLLMIISQDSFFSFSNWFEYVKHYLIILKSNSMKAIIILNNLTGLPHLLFRVLLHQVSFSHQTGIQTQNSKISAQQYVTFYLLHAVKNNISVNWSWKTRIFLRKGGKSAPLKGNNFNLVSLAFFFAKYYLF